MSEQENKQTIEEEIRKNLSGDLQKNALDFAAYINNSSGALQHLGDDICGMVIFPPKDSPPSGLYIFFGGPNSSICASDYKNYPINESIKEFAWAHINHCAHFRSNGKICGCGDQPGYSLMILGKKFDNLCHCPICFENPDSETFEKIRELAEAWKRCIEELKKSD